MKEEFDYLSSAGDGEVSLARAKGNESWAATWRQPELRGEVDPISGYAPRYARASIATWKVNEEHVNLRGLGALRLYFADLPIDGGYDPDVLVNFVAGSVHLAQRSFNRYQLRELVAGLPTRYAVHDEASHVLQAFAALESVYSSAYLYRNKYDVRPDWQHRLILPRAAAEDYGRLWVPISQAELLVEANAVPANDARLADTHVYCNVLASKHALFETLGFGHLIARDLERVARWQVMQEKSA